MRTSGPEFSGPLDEVDKAIVRVLADDGRIGYEALARRLGISSSTTRQRAKRLLESGTVVVHGLVHPSVFGLNRSAHVTIGCTGAAHPVAEKIAAEPDVALVSLVAGHRPIVAEVRTRDERSLNEVLRRVSATEGVTSTETSLYLNIFRGANVQIAPEVVAVDTIDRQLLRSIQRDGRRSFADLADDVGLSTAATRTRVLRMLDANIVKIEARVPPRVGGESQIGIGVIARGLDPDPVAALQELDTVRFLAATLGHFTAVGTLHVDPGDPEWDAIDQVRTVPGVVAVETWRHLHFLKDVYDSDSAGGTARGG